MNQLEIIEMKVMSPEIKEINFRLDPVQEKTNILKRLNSHKTKFREIRRFKNMKYRDT